MKDIVAFGKAIADPTRARILNALRNQELCVCEIVDAFEISQSTLSTHLQTLRNAGVVTTKKRGTWISYEIDPGARAAVDAVFEHFESDDERAQRDRERLEERLCLRVDGCCVVGSGGLIRDLTGGKC